MLEIAIDGLNMVEKERRSNHSVWDCEKVEIRGFNLLISNFGKLVVFSPLPLISR